MKVYNEEFRLLSCRSSLSKVLIRANKFISDENINIDLFFKGVIFMDIPMRFNDIIIEEATEDDIKFVLSRINIPHPSKTHFEFKKSIYVLVSSNIRYYVVAGTFEINENKLQPNELPDYF